MQTPCTIYLKSIYSILVVTFSEYSEYTRLLIMFIQLDKLIQTCYNVKLKGRDNVAKKSEVEKNTSTPTKKQARISQSACPSHTLEDALKIPQAIKENFAGQPTDPMLLSQACGYSPSSSNWRTLTGAAIAYGIADGGYNSKEISITSLGERIVAPLVEGDDLIAKKEASLIPTVLKVFFTQYDRNKFPREDIAKNVLISKGVPADRVDGVYDIIRANGRFVNTIQILSGSEYIRLGDNVCVTAAPATNSNQTDLDADVSDSSDTIDVDIPQDLAVRMNISKPEESVQKVQETPVIPRVFISHGKNSKVIVGQLKELLTYGQMEAIVSVEKETTAISVPDKVFDDMRSCHAGIIHVCQESCTDTEDHVVSKLNENVLIEIGAAMALYGKRIIILCAKDTKLPSNLQGLYRCEYEGDQLDYTSTMKLLKTLQELRKML